MDYAIHIISDATRNVAKASDKGLGRPRKPLQGVRQTPKLSWSVLQPMHRESRIFQHPSMLAVTKLLVLTCMSI